jgi:predicted RNA-binding Zn-ribbon protein involved in translation (DUF1610 family)
VYSKCLNCGATTIIPDVSLRDDSGAYGASNHQVIIECNPTAIFKREPVFAQTRAYICGTCGYVALFVEAPGKLYAGYREAQEQIAQQRARDEHIPRLIQHAMPES